MKFNYITKEGITFHVICDYESIIAKINADKDKFTNDFQRYYTVGYEDGYLTQEEYIQNLVDMENRLNEIISPIKMIEFIKKSKKKKNGMFYKGRIVFREGCDNTTYITEWHNTWIYDALSISAVSEDTLKIEYIKITDTPG